MESIGIYNLQVRDIRRIGAVERSSDTSPDLFLCRLRNPAFISESSCMRVRKYSKLAWEKLFYVSLLHWDLCTPRACPTRTKKNNTRLLHVTNNVFLINYLLTLLVLLKIIVFFTC